MRAPLCSPDFPPFALRWPRTRFIGKRTDVPALPPEFMSGVVFLYRTVEEARTHARIGGTAFPFGKLAGATGPKPEDRFYVAYLVTNSHLALGRSATVMRANRRDGKPPDIFDIDQNDWIPVPGQDLAITPMGRIVNAEGVQMRRDTHEYIFVDEEMVLTKEMIAHHQVGVGDEVFMIGRFMNMQGADRNEPAARFGSISMMPSPLYNQWLKQQQISFAVEMRSRTGFSGAPVVVYGHRLTTLKERKHPTFFFLLGVNWGYVVDPDADPGEENTWLNGVVPGWEILEAFKLPKLADIHAAAAAEARALMESKGAAVLTGTPSSPEVAKPEPPATKGDEQHKERFTSLMDAVLGKPKPAD